MGLFNCFKLNVKHTLCEFVIIFFINKTSLISKHNCMDHSSFKINSLSLQHVYGLIWETFLANA